MKLQDSLQLIRGANSKLAKNAQHQASAFESATLPKLVSLIESMDAVKVAKPRFCPDAYLKMWADFRKGKVTEIPSRVRRFLCWEPKVGCNLSFLEYLQGLKDTPGANAIQGLVHAQHMEWAEGESHEKKLQLLARAVRGYRGRNRLVEKWKANLRMVAHPDAPTAAAKVMFPKLQPIDIFCGEWGFNEQTRFVREVAAECTRLCFKTIRGGNEDIERYLIGEILPWPHFPASDYKRIISHLALTENFAREGKFQEKALEQVIGDDRLGDPRLPANSQNWVGVDPEAKAKILNLLSRADIVFFFDQVMTKYDDRHGRKKFWLRYVSSLRQSRPLLNTVDKQRLYSVMRRQGKKMLHFGDTRGPYSSFLLDFGSVLVVEFNGVGRIYMYEDKARRRLFPDIYTDEPYTDAILKQPDYAIYRKSHVGNWQSDIQYILSQFGIRPT